MWQSLKVHVKKQYTVFVSWHVLVWHTLHALTMTLLRVSSSIDCPCFSLFDSISIACMHHVVDDSDSGNVDIVHKCSVHSPASCL
jgi:hypothetical protein